MRLFAISDLHLSLSANKPMDIFPGWENYESRLYENWQKVVNSDDTVVIAGDVSWGMSLEQSLKDFEFIDRLNGRKIIIKGNHDYWWSTVSKIESFFAEKGFNSLNILHNNCFSDGQYAICGTRGWVYDGTGETDIRVINRECGRLERSIKEAQKLNAKPIVFLHYPPVYGEFVCGEIIAVLKEYGIDRVYYGHIHGGAAYKTVSVYDGITLKILSADRLLFTPKLIGECSNFEKIVK